MIKIPNFKNSFEYENNFYLTCDNNRISKIITQYELYKRVSTIPGHIVECGVFKGTSLVRFATFRELFKNNSKIYKISKTMNILKILKIYQIGQIFKNSNNLENQPWWFL